LLTKIKGKSKRQKMASKSSDSYSILAPIHAFGMNCNARQDFQLKNTKHIIYTAGQYFIQQNLLEKKQDFSRGQDKFSMITAICLSTDGKYSSVFNEDPWQWRKNRKIRTKR
jgi:hypothetical protein